MLSEPLINAGPTARRPALDVGAWARPVWAAVLFSSCAAVALLTVAYTRTPPLPSAAVATSLYGPSGEFDPDGTSSKIDVDAVRKAAKAFIDSLGPDNAKAYYPDAALQVKQWQVCTIVQQCLVPDYALAIGALQAPSRTLFLDILAEVLSDESYKRIMLQQLSNLLLGEMQTWATRCPGQCAELASKDGLLPNHLLIDDTLDTHVIANASFGECARMAAAKRHVLWECTQPPRMLHHGNIDTATGKYFLGNIFDEPRIHARNNNFDYVAVYGSLEPGQPFGFRYSGHHFDLSFRFDADGRLISDLPTFLGHNPLIVPRQTPAIKGAHEDYLQWHNMAGFPQFPDAVHVVLRAAAVLDDAWYVPLQQWDSTPATGGLSLKGGRDMRDVNHVRMGELDEHTFDTLWALIDYTLEFARGARPRPEKDAFRREGRLCWTTCVHHAGDDIRKHLPRDVADLMGQRTFIYVRAETDELLFFAMINSLFTLVLEQEPSNHLHSMFIPKAYLQ